MMKFNNVPDYAKKYTYLVFRRDEEDFSNCWFWGAYDNSIKADEVALEIDGEVWHYEQIRNLIESGKAE